MRQRQKRVPLNRSDVDAFVRHRDGSESRCRKALMYIYRPVRLPTDVDGLRELRSMFFHPDESAGCLDRRIVELEQGVVP